jgi:hypothetical protein
MGAEGKIIWGDREDPFSVSDGNVQPVGHLVGLLNARVTCKEEEALFENKDGSEIKFSVRRGEQRLDVTFRSYLRGYQLRQQQVRLLMEMK